MGRVEEGGIVGRDRISDRGLWLFHHRFPQIQSCFHLHIQRSLATDGQDLELTWFNNKEGSVCVCGGKHDWICGNR